MEKLATIVLVGNLDCLYTKLVPTFPYCEFLCSSYNQFYVDVLERKIHILLLEWREEELGLYRLMFLKRLKPKLNIIMINTYSYPIRRAMFRGASSVVECPLVFEEIQELIDSFID